MIEFQNIKPGLPVTWVDDPGFVPRMGGLMLKEPPAVLCGRPMRLTGHFRINSWGEYQLECRGVLRGEPTKWWMHQHELVAIN